MGIEGKVVAVTGAGSGIGAATAELLAARGARLVLAGRRADRLREVAARIEGDVVWQVTDVRRRADLRALVALAVERFGRLDVLVGNAGVATVAPLGDLTDEQIDDMIDVNLRGVLNGITAALPVFRRQGGGHFVQTVSTSGLRIVPGQTVYAGVKNAVRTISEGLRQEVGASIRVTAVSPGMTRTEFVGDRPPHGSPTALATWEQVQRVAIDPGAIARAIAFAVEQPEDVDVNEIVVRPSAQG
ncbi:SDR family oxidoreductase [Kineosporia sp. J2-2]|uniref:SDR family oxidoreductase n=1 Tax=Kineosporia corallincola TaxID=2835133 RepID=A0ABS5TRP4_9ACTN|nr:SDR family oxidoreductase [Kineosporia corallincola]MBT0773472.1 SDR family oxidoreductase [Kineosporia corallincola]